jgi:hypothetical protein
MHHFPNVLHFYSRLRVTQHGLQLNPQSPLNLLLPQRLVLRRHAKATLPDGEITMVIVAYFMKCMTSLVAPVTDGGTERREVLHGKIVVTAG